MAQNLRRNTKDQVLGGVAAGIGNYFDIDAWIIRIIFIVLFFSGGGLLIYIIMWIALPQQTQNNTDTMSDNNKPSRSDNGNLIAGVLLITIGGLILISRYFPEIDFRDIWPWSLIIIGVLLLFKGISKNKSN